MVFFSNKTTNSKSIASSYEKTVRSGLVNEENGIKFELISINKSGNKAIFKFNVVSLNKDNHLTIYSSMNKMYDENGIEKEPSKIKLSDKTGANPNYKLIQGIQVPLELTYDNISSSAKGVSLLKVGFQLQGVGNLEFSKRNLSFEGFDSSLKIPKNKGIWSTQENGLEFHLLEYYKSGNKAIFKFNVVSLDKDNHLTIYSSMNKMYDENGIEKEPSKIKLSDKTGANPNYKLIQGIQVPLELTYDNISSSAKGVSLLKVGFQLQGVGNLEFSKRNLSFEGFDSSLKIPKNKGIWSTQENGLEFHLLEYYKSGNKAIFKFNVVSLDKDNHLTIYSSMNKMYDENGIEKEPSKIKLSDKTGANPNYKLIQGIQVPLELTYDNISSSAKGVSLLKVGFQLQGVGNLEFSKRNLSFEGFDSSLKIPKNKGIWSTQENGLEFHLLEYYKSGNKAIFKFNVVSLDKDNHLTIYSSMNKMYDENGIEKEPSKIKLSDKTGANPNYKLIQGIQVPLELTYDNISSSAKGVSLLKVGFQLQGVGNLEFSKRNLSFE